jgi:hypothetical protein
MQTLHDDLRNEVAQYLVKELDSGDLEDGWANQLFLRATDNVLKKVWEYVEDYKIDSNNRLIFEYGMLKHLLQGEKDA